MACCVATVKAQPAYCFSSSVVHELDAKFLPTYTAVTAQQKTLRGVVIGCKLSSR